MINHSGFFTRSSSLWGSRNDSTFTLLASSISPDVRWRMKIGFPRHLIMTCVIVSLGSRCGRVPAVAQRTFFPSGMLARSTSTLAMAKTSAEADMLTRKSVWFPVSAFRSQLSPPVPFIVSSSRPDADPNLHAHHLASPHFHCNAPVTVDFAPAAVIAPMVPIHEHQLANCPQLSIHPNSSSLHPPFEPVATYQP